MFGKLLVPGRKVNFLSYKLLSGYTKSSKVQGVPYTLYRTINFRDNIGILCQQ